MVGVGWALILAFAVQFTLGRGCKFWELYRKLPNCWLDSDER